MHVERELISKKELLERTGISYGQLYRWKRKKLIPEDWFIRKSTFTGQETFFPRERILERINKILSMKDSHSLDELADQFSPNPAEIALSADEVLKRHIVSKTTLDYFYEQTGAMESFTFDKLLQVYVLEQILRTGAISLDEARIVLAALADHYDQLQGKSCELLFIRKFGLATCLFVTAPGEVYFEKDVKVAIRLPLARAIEELKEKINAT
jgi:predicted DNA-binding transcriptional regulator AlpA